MTVSRLHLLMRLAVRRLNRQIVVEVFYQGTHRFGMKERLTTGIGKVHATEGLRAKIRSKS